MPNFLDIAALNSRREVTDLWHRRLSAWIRMGWLSPTEAKQGILDLRAAGTIDDTETEGLIERLRLGEE